MSWPAIAAARQRTVPRVPLEVAGREIGSVAVAHLETLAALARAHPALQVDARRVVLRAHAPDAAFAAINAELRAAGHIRGWRDEPYPIVEPTSGRRLGRIERAASRFWGLLTFGAHANGVVVDARGQPQAMWIAQRALTKATDPGRLDNLVGGGVPDGQTPRETVVREGWEEAGLQPALMAGAVAGRALRLCADIPEGLQHEQLQVFDLELPAHVTPINQDGEVAGFRCVPLDEALVLAAGEQMTTDAALVVLEFALRRRLLPAADQRRLEAATSALWGATVPLPS